MWNALARVTAACDGREDAPRALALARVMDALARVMDALARVMDALARVTDALARVVWMRSRV
jgi:ABC-type transporter Mla subunit MlaD